MWKIISSQILDSVSWYKTRTSGMCLYYQCESILYWEGIRGEKSDDPTLVVKDPVYVP